MSNFEMSPDALYEMDLVYDKVRTLVDPEKCGSPGLYLAGGAVRDFVYGLEITDYDFFVLPGDLAKYRDEGRQEVFWNKLALLLDALRHSVKNPDLGVVRAQVIDWEDYNSLKSRFQRDADLDWTLRLADIYTKSLEGSEEKIQVLVRPIGDLQTLVDSFDLDICQFGYDGANLIVGSEANPTEVRSALFEGGPVKLVNRCSTYYRLKKFRDRYGCSVEDAARDLNHLVREEGPHIFHGISSDDENWVYWKSRSSILSLPREDPDVPGPLEAWLNSAYKK